MDEFLERVAQLLWWNAGINDPDKLKKKMVFVDTGKPVAGPSWKAVANKDMWRRMAVAAFLECGADGLRALKDPELQKKYQCRADVPK